MNAFTGTKFVPALHGSSPSGNYRATFTIYNLTPGSIIVPCMTYTHNFENVCIFEVYYEFLYVADAASLEAALAILSDKYNDSLPLPF